VTHQTQGILGLERSTLILKINHVDLILLIWMKMKKRCSKNAELALPTLKVRKPKERQEKSSSKKLED